MSFYYFHLFEDGEFSVDEEGVDLPDDDAAYEHAIAAARSIIGMDALDGRIALDRRIEIEDEQGTVRTVPFSETVTVRGAPEEP